MNEARMKKAKTSANKNAARTSTKPTSTKKKPAAKARVGKTAAAKKSVIKKPAVKKPAAKKKRSTKKLLSKKSVTKKPVTKQVASKKSASKKAAPKKAIAKKAVQQKTAGKKAATPTKTIVGTRKAAATKTTPTQVASKQTASTRTSKGNTAGRKAKPAGRAKSQPQGRIFFIGNPWPEGHPVEEFAWTARLVDDELWFDLHLRSADYDSEREIEYDDDTDYDSDWEAPIVWNNYHRCTLSSTFWGEIGGIRVCRLDAFSLAWLDGRVFELDPADGEVDDDEDHAFHIYLLGHDSVANHRIEFRRQGDSNRFDIHWTGDIAQTYIGHNSLDHRFEATILGVACPALPR
jgi:hypothetical protein